MDCEHCHENEATIHLMVGALDGEKRAVHLCLSCALKSGANSELPLPAGQLAELLKQFGDTIGTPFLQSMAKASAVPPPDDEPVAAVCPDCGTSDVMFRRQQRLGCPTCYETFNEEILDLLPSLHRKGTRHRGRGPADSLAAANPARGRLLSSQRLRQQLALAIAAEDYERASRLRDEIRSLEHSDQGGLL